MYTYNIHTYENFKLLKTETSNDNNELIAGKLNPLAGTVQSTFHVLSHLTQQLSEVEIISCPFL